MGRLISDKYKEWAAECDARFNQLKANEEELNRIFIEIYGLQDELTPTVLDKDVTVRKFTSITFCITLYKIEPLHICMEFPNHYLSKYLIVNSAYSFSIFLLSLKDQPSSI